MISTPLVEGFDEVYKRNYTRLSQYAFHIIHDKGDAEDLANEAFLVYYQHADEMDIENPDAYLFKILRNLIGNYIKRRDLHPTLSLDILEETADIQSSPEPLEYLLPQGLSQDERDTSFKEQDKIEHFRCCLRLRKKFSRIYFAVIWFILFLVAIAFFLLSPTTKWFSKEFAILDEIISLIIVCFWTYRFMVPSFVKSKRRNWYKKILPEQSASLYVQISASHLEFCSATGKSVIFSYKPQTKKGERNLPKKDQTIGERNPESQILHRHCQTSFPTPPLPVELLRGLFHTLFLFFAEHRRRAFVCPFFPEWRQ